MKDRDTGSGGLGVKGVLTADRQMIFFKENNLKKINILINLGNFTIGDMRAPLFVLQIYRK